MKKNIKNDLIVFGATGFTGKLVVEYLIKNYGLENQKFTWAIAGRDKGKLEQLKQSFIGTGGPRSNSKLKNEIFQEYIEVSKIIEMPLRKFGSASLDLANVACGRFDGFWQRELNYWDIAAGLIILKEAGGFVEFFEVDKNHLLKKNILATNSNIHEELKDQLNKKDIE